MLNKNTLLKIRKLALKIDWDVSFKGESKGNKHLFRIVKIAKFLAERTNANLLIVEAGALLHDTNLPSENDYNYQRNKQTVKKLLKSFNLTESELNGIAECAASHEGIIKPKTLEAKIVHDADVLEKSGMLGIIRHTWKLTNLKKIKSSNIDSQTAQKILDHIRWRGKMLQIPLAQKLYEYLDVSVRKKRLTGMVRKTAELAEQGIVTEKIADLLSKELSNDQRAKLKQQLNLTYLRKFQEVFRNR